MQNVFPPSSGRVQVPPWNSTGLTLREETGLSPECGNLVRAGPNKVVFFWGGGGLKLDLMTSLVTDDWGVVGVPGPDGARGARRRRGVLSQSPGGSSYTDPFSALPNSPASGYIRRRHHLSPAEATKDG